MKKQIKINKENPLSKAIVKDNIQRYVNAYCVHDTEANIYDIPFFTRGDTFALRKFTMDVRSENVSMLTTFKDKFNLVRIGKFDLIKGTFIVEDHEILIYGADIKR